MVVAAFAVLWKMEMRQRQIESPNVQSEVATLKEELVWAKLSIKWHEKRVRELEAGEGSRTSDR